MVVGGQLQAPAALPLRKESLVPIGVVNRISVLFFW
jgi:hypothetical protein